MINILNTEKDDKWFIVLRHQALREVVVRDPRVPRRRFALRASSWRWFLDSRNYRHQCSVVHESLALRWFQISGGIRQVGLRLHVLEDRGLELAQLWLLGIGHGRQVGDELSVVLVILTTFWLEVRHRGPAIEHVNG